MVVAFLLLYAVEIICITYTYDFYILDSLHNKLLRLPLATTELNRSPSPPATDRSRLIT